VSCLGGARQCIGGELVFVCAQTQVEDGSGFLNEEEGEGGNGRRQMRPLSGCSPASLEGTEDCVINARVVGNSLEIHHWSTLWSQVSI
jgi:hypothetical protein